MIKCPNCTGEMNFQPGDQLIVCQYCGSKFDPNALNLQSNVSKKVSDQINGTSYMCTQCGAVLLTFDETAITFCSYCGSQAMIESNMTTINKPDFIIPFKVTKEECVKKYKELVNRRLFVPKNIKSDIIVEKFRGIYLPYGIYKFKYNGSAEYDGEKFKMHLGNYDYYDEYKITCDLDSSFEGVSKDLRSNFYDYFSDNLPFNMEGMEEFNNNYLIGYYADCADVDPATYSGDMSDIALYETQKMLNKQENFRKYGCKYAAVPFPKPEVSYAMFPFYFLAFRNKNNDRVYYSVVNGQTGDIMADLPLSIPKYIGLALVCSLLILLLLFHSMVFTMTKLAVVSIVLSVVAFITCLVQINKISSKFFHFDDIAYMEKHYLDEKETTKKYYKYAIKPVLGAIFPVLVLALDLVSDKYYYGAIIISFLLILLSFRDILYLHNLLLSNKIPQLEKRGGDESE